MLRWSAPEETRPAMSISRYAQSRAQPDFRTSTLKSSPSACTGTRVAPLARACSSAIADCCRASPFTPRHRRARWYRARPSSLVQLAAPPRHLLPRARAVQLAGHALSRHSCGLRALRAAGKSFEGLGGRDGLLDCHAFTDVANFTTLPDLRISANRLCECRLSLTLPRLWSPRLRA